MLSSMSQKSPPESPPSTPQIHLPSLGSHFRGGFWSGAVSAVLLQPADLIKTRIQQSHPPTTIWKTLKSITQGPSPVFALWRGTMPSLYRTSFGSAMYFSTLAGLREHLATKKQRELSHSNHISGAHSSALVQLSPAVNLLTGAFARATVGFVVMPITIIKVRFESDLYAYKSTHEAAKSIFRTEGIPGFFRGWGATAARDAPYAGLYLFFYEFGKKTLSPFALSLSGEEGGMDSTSAVIINLVSSGIAGAMATAVTNPFDTLKTRIQVLPGAYTNMWSAGVKILKEEGFIRLFDGLAIRMGRKAFSSSVVWTIYEYFIASRKKSSKEEKL